MSKLNKPVSIYIHWPYCLSLCPYCDFNSHLADEVRVEEWINSYIKEISYFKNRIENKKIKSIFFGGGTPSLMNPKIPGAIIDFLAKIGRVDDSTEITLEANPTSYETEKFKQFKLAGINRVSIGVQSFDDNNLKLLGRKHSANSAKNAIESAAKIFDKFSFDLIYALPNQDLNQWKKELEFAMQMAKSHISLYQLTIEKGTPFYGLHKSGKLILPDNEIAADMYDWTNDFLHQHNFNRYEISNYAIRGQECLHNICYWDYDEYIGIGPGAHSRLHNANNISAVMMVHNPKKWLQNVASKGHGIQSNAILSTKEAIEEFVMMGLRLKNGVFEANLQSKLNCNLIDIFDTNKIDEFMASGMVEYNGNVIKLTDKGLLLHSYLVPRLIKD